MHELSYLSVEGVMGPSYSKPTNSSLRKQSQGTPERPVKSQVRRQSVATTRMGSSSRPGREPEKSRAAPQKPFCATVSRSSSFGSRSSPPSYMRSRVKSVVEVPLRNEPSRRISRGGKDAVKDQGKLYCFETHVGVQLGADRGLKCFQNFPKQCRP